jgi:hypothetical protein
MVLVLLALGNLFGLHQRNAKVTYKPTLDCIMTYTTREGSLICLMIGNNSNISSINEQRSDSAIGHVYFCFKMDGRESKRESTIGQWRRFKKNNRNK